MTTKRRPFNLHRFILESNKIDRQFDENKQLIPGRRPGEPMYDRHLAAWEVAVELFSRDPVPATVWLDIHRALTRDLSIYESRNASGKYRTERVKINHMYAPPCHIIRPLLEENLAQVINETIASSIARDHDSNAWAVHNYFECIHPFLDGNGRTGRIGMNALRQRLGINPIVIHERYRHLYYERIQHFRDHVFSSWYEPSPHDRVEAMMDRLGWGGPW